MDTSIVYIRSVSISLPFFVMYKPPKLELRLIVAAVVVTVALKVEEAREKGTLEFQPDVKATFMGLLPLRSISRFWGTLTSVELPMWLRAYVYKGWARAFHSNLEEVALPLEEYASLREFFVRRLKEGIRPIDSDPCCLISPVDGTVLQFGELKEAGAMIEQVKGFSYSVSSLLGASSFLPMTMVDDNKNQDGWPEGSTDDLNQKSWWRVSLASPKVRDPAPARPMKGLFYCVIYLRLGDYHRIHSPADWNVLGRRHFSGRLFPVNERATRTIRNLYVENERVVLEGKWQEGFMAMAAVGATNIGSIELFIEPTLRTNRPWKKLLHPEPPEEQVYEPKGAGVLLKKGDELSIWVRQWLWSSKLRSHNLLQIKARQQNSVFVLKRETGSAWERPWAGGMIPSYNISITELRVVSLYYRKA
ncbi:phosphatidylserine decarboxylase proenzyme 1, mitochondrial isoform X3 [Lycium ferocissimum]|uniref:phosphatidylserine decarboxylase proenzyme 1, mitochondrial isoform X3 n=1 Tax=Lycium ferocissimum TaxID=112874 RepID=UPI00281639BD|nr:phosphatidylserine decarboxylase proenzyme 1, mitochondrial isoform X3 [Lycium ferocissimum]